MIELIDFNKTYNSLSGKSFTVEKVSFTVETDCITGLVGPNGSGKSTIIKAITGFHYPTKGKIFISDNKNNKYDISETPEMAMKLCGYVPEISTLPPNMKVLDFLIFCGKNHGLKDKELEKAVKKVTEDFSLFDFLNNKIKILSKGQQQRVSFAQALIHNPPNLILDEPISGLDPSQIIALRDYVKKVSKTKSVLVSTHILSEINNLCKKAFMMNEGHLFQVSDLSDIEKEFLELSKKLEKNK